MSKVLCIYHANCADGLGAAWAVWRALGPEVEFVAAKYGELPPYCLPRHPGGKDVWDASLLEGRDVLIVDFSYPLPVLRAMAREVRSVLVLDHHKTAREDLESLPNTFPSWEDWQKTILNWPSPPRLAAIFDLERSGAGLTWDYLNNGGSSENNRNDGIPVLYSNVNNDDNKHRSRRPRIIDLIEDRDLWKFHHGDETRAFHAVLTSYDIGDLPEMFKRLDAWNDDSTDAELAKCRPTIDELEGILQRDSHQNIEILPTGEITGTRNNWANLLSEGHAILRANAQAVANAVAASRRTIKIAGHTVPCAHVPGSMASDAGHLLCEDILKKSKEMDVEPLFSATYYDGTDGRRHFSLRSPPGGADVGQIARQMAEILTQWCGQQFTGGGHEHAAGFDAPLGWEGE